MPTATTTLGWTLVNWGSAPSRWPSSASCTAFDNVYFADNNLPEAPVLFESCPTNTIEDCWPQPTSSEFVSDYLRNQRNIPYWSPGVECPSGWESIGAASRPSDGDLTSTGIFTVGAIPTDWDNNDPITFGIQGALGTILDPSETAIACCPSSMSVGRNGLCYSTLPSHTISTVCYADYAERDPDLEVVTSTFIVGGVTHTGRVVVPTVTIPRIPTRTTTRTIDADETSALVAASMTGPIYLVHQRSDRDDLSDSPDSTGSSGSDRESDSESDNDTNAASRLAMGQPGSWVRLTGMAGVFAVSVLAGMTLVLPW